MILQSTDNSISLNDIYFLWKIYLKNKNIPNTILKTEFELILKNKLLNNNNNFLDVKSNYLDNVKELVQLENDYLSSPEKLLELSNLYFDDELHLLTSMFQNI